MDQWKWAYWWITMYHLIISCGTPEPGCCPYQHPDVDPYHHFDTSPNNISVWQQKHLITPGQTIHRDMIGQYQRSRSRSLNDVPDLELRKTQKNVAMGQRPSRYGKNAGLLTTALLNREMDHLAGKAYTMNQDWQTSPCCQILPDKKWGIFAEGQNITSKLCSTIHFQYHQMETEAYIQKKNQLHETDMNRINWMGLDGKILKLLITTWTTMVKFIYDWLSTQQFLCRKKKAELDNCSVCAKTNSSKMIQHLISCKEVILTANCLNIWKQCYHSLKVKAKHHH